MRVFLKPEEYDKVLQRLAAEVIEKECLDKLIIVGIKSRGDILGERLRKIIKDRTGHDIPLGAISINLYRDDLTCASETPQIKKTDIPFDIKDKHILLVDDVLYTGRTIRAAMNALFDYGRPARVVLLALADRGGRELPICANYVGVGINLSQDEYMSVKVLELEGEDIIVIKPRPNK